MGKSKNSDTEAQTLPVVGEEISTPPVVDSELFNVGAIADNLADSMPEVQQHTIEAMQQIPTDSNMIDCDGTIFDPDIHKALNGQPTKSKLGRFMKKPGRKAADKSALNIPENKLPDRSAEIIKTQCRAAGQLAAQTLITLGTTIGGEEWIPIKSEQHGIDERVNLEMAFANYFEATGLTDIPPGWALSIAVGGYILPRFAMPKTQSKFKVFKNWVIGKYVTWKIKRSGGEIQ